MQPLLCENVSNININIPPCDRLSSCRVLPQNIVIVYLPVVNVLLDIK